MHRGATVSSTVVYAVTLVLFGVVPPSGSTENLPNVLLIVADDLGYSDLGIKDSSIYTPYIDELSHEGVKFRYSYTHTQCTPSRAALLTGYYSYRTGLQHGVIPLYSNKALPLNFDLLPQVLKEKANYSTYLFGKWHLGHNKWEHTPTERGFDYFYGFYSGQEGYYIHYGFDEWKGLGLVPDWEKSYDFRETYTTSDSALFKYGPEQVVDKIKEKLDNDVTNETDNPFFIFWSMQTPHVPLNPPDRFLEMYNETYDNATNRAKYKALLTSMDEQVEDVIEYLKEKNLYHNTVIIFTSDNGGKVWNSGGACNYPLRGSKGSIFEGGTRVITFVHAPHLLKANGKVVTDGFFHITDWLPTISEGIAKIELCTEDNENSTLCNIDGINQWDNIVHATEFTRNEFVYEIDQLSGHAGIRNGRYKLISIPESYNTQIWDCQNETYVEAVENDPDNLNETISVTATSDNFLFLFDIENDPTESHNLALAELNTTQALYRRLKYKYLPQLTKSIDDSDQEFGKDTYHTHTLSPGFGCTVDSTELESGHHL